MNSLEDDEAAFGRQRGNLVTNRQEGYIKELGQIGSGAGLFFGGQIIGVGFVYLAHVIVARCFGPEAFGVYALGFAAYKLSTTLAVLGTDEALVRFLAVHRSVGDEPRIEHTYILARRTGLVSSIVVGTLLFVVSPFVSEWIFQEQGLASVLRLFAVSLPLWTMINQTSFACRAVGRVDFAVIARDLAYPIINFLFVLLLSLLGFSVLSAVAAHGLAASAAAVAGLVLFRRAFPRARSNFTVVSRSEKRNFLSASVAIAFAGLLSVLMNWIDTMMLGYFASTAEVGVYNAAARTSNLINYLPIAFGAVVGPMVASLYHSGEKDKLGHLYRIATRWSLLFGCPLCLGLILFSRDILGIFGASFDRGAYALVILSGAQMLNLATGLSGYLLIMSGNEKSVLVVQAIGVFSNIMLNLWFIPRWGIVGAAVATALSLIGVNLLRQYLVYRFYMLHPIDGGYCKPFIAAGAAALMIVCFIGHVEWYYLAMAFGIAYVAGVFVLGATEEERTLLRDAACQLMKSN